MKKFNLAQDTIIEGAMTTYRLSLFHGKKLIATTEHFESYYDLEGTTKLFECFIDYLNDALEEGTIKAKSVNRLVKRLFPKRYEGKSEIDAAWEIVEIVGPPSNGKSVRR